MNDLTDAYSIIAFRYNKKSIVVAREILAAWQKDINIDVRIEAFSLLFESKTKRKEALAQWLPIVKADHSMIPFMRAGLEYAQECGEMARTILWLLRSENGR